MKTSIILFALAVFALRIFCKICERCFDDNDPDMFWYDNYAAPSKGYYGNDLPQLKCQHLGEKNLVAEWTACGCEKVNMHCDDCGKILVEGAVEC